jgi:hypothetical protein
VARENDLFPLGDSLSGISYPADQRAITWPRTTRAVSSILAPTSLPWSCGFAPKVANPQDWISLFSSEVIVENPLMRADLRRFNGHADLRLRSNRHDDFSVCFPQPDLICPVKGQALIKIVGSNPDGSTWFVYASPIVTLAEMRGGNDK